MKNERIDRNADAAELSDADLAQVSGGVTTDAELTCRKAGKDQQELLGSPAPIIAI